MNDASRDASVETYQRFIGAARGYWSKQMFQALQRQAPKNTPDVAALESQLDKHPTYQIFSWFERHLQRMKYSGQMGLVERNERLRPALLERLAAPIPDGLLRLDPLLKPPAYYGAYDIHQHPGGLAGDALAAFVYADAVNSGVVGKPDLHDMFARLAVEGRDVHQVLDLGCGFGRSSLAFANAAPQAQIHGVDISASCVTLAAQKTPEELRTRTQFTQADALSTGFADESFDMITSTMLLHEMPQQAVSKLITETGRLLRPGGAVIHLDFLAPEDPLLQIFFAGHSRRNNEPYLMEHGSIDLESAYGSAGFTSVSTIDFAEDDDALKTPPERWRLPWKIIVAKK